MTSGFVTLPIRLRGSLLTVIIREGILYGARRSLHHSLRDSGLTSCSSLRTRAAHTLSPHSSSPRPTTAHSSISGCPLRTSSISSAEILYPPLLIISTDFLPRILYAPSPLLSARSPVLNHPPSIKAPLVDSGLFQYSRKTFFPLTIISPAPSPLITPPLSSITPTPPPGRGIPARPGFLPPRRGRDQWRGGRRDYSKGKERLPGV